VLLTARGIRYARPMTTHRDQRRRRASPFARIWDAIHDLQERTENMATQADVDALTASVDQVATDLATARTTLQQEIDSLAQQNPGLDLSALTAAVAPIDQAVQALGALKPDPAPAPTPTPPAGS